MGALALFSAVACSTTNSFCWTWTWRSAPAAGGLPDACSSCALCTCLRCSRPTTWQDIAWHGVMPACESTRQRTGCMPEGMAHCTASCIACCHRFVHRCSEHVKGLAALSAVGQRTRSSCGVLPAVLLPLPVCWLHFSFSGELGCCSIYTPPHNVAWLVVCLGLATGLAVWRQMLALEWSLTHGIIIINSCDHVSLGESTLHMGR